jgi:phosphatidylglycerophosphate synthase
MSIARPQHRELFSSAVLGILPAVVLAVMSALVIAPALGLAALYAAKVLLVVSIGAVLLIGTLPHYHPFQRIGSANRVTIARGALTALLAGLIGEPSSAAVCWFVVVIATITAVLDGVDGWFARRTQMQSAFGARFDMETDALFILVLAILVWQSGKVGGWILIGGVLRYAFVVASMLLPWLKRPLPPSQRRKTGAVVQMVALIVAIGPIIPVLLSNAVAALALCFLVLSFAIDIAWLARRARECLPALQS